LAIGEIRFKSLKPREQEVLASNAERKMESSFSPPVQPTVKTERAMAKPRLLAEPSLIIEKPQEIKQTTSIELQKAKPEPAAEVHKAKLEDEGSQGLDQIPLMDEPRTRKTVQPDYPRLARRRAYEGLVLVRAKIGLDGLVLSVALKQSSGHHSLDMSALKAVSHWHFHPYQVGGRLTVAWVDIPLEFTLGP
jgi:protein TonB